MEIRDDELEHYGRKGMKWYQHIFSKEVSTARKRNKALKKARKTRKKNAAAKKKAEKAAAKAAKRRVDILRDPGKLYKHRYEFTKEDIDAALKNFEWEEKVQQYHTNRTTYAATIVGNYIRLAGNVVAGYNTVASVYNAWFPDQSIPTVKPDLIKPVGGGGGGGKKK